MHIYICVGVDTQEGRNDAVYESVTREQHRATQVVVSG